MKNKFSLIAVLSSLTFSVNAQFWDFTDPVKLMGTINTEMEENMPVFSQDSSKLYFVRTYDPDNAGGIYDQDIWVSTEDTTDNSYNDCKKVKELNNKFNNAVVGLSKDGSRMYVFNTYEGKKDLMKGISVSENKDGKWGTPKPLEIPNLDIDGKSYGFHVGSKEDVVIISHEGAGTMGEEDLYYSIKKDGVWSAPVHMGSAINSSGYEISPFLSPNYDTLYFASNGFGGEGDADIFYSVRQGTSWTDWSAPKNLGNRINSPKFDAYFSYSGRQAYWSSNRDAQYADIWMINILTPPPIELTCSASDATVYHGMDGSIDAMIEGGAPPFVFSWSNGSSAEDLIGVGMGEYTLTVTDQVGQTASVTCSVDEPAKPIEPVVVTTYPNPEFMHNFAYNKNKLSPTKGDLKRFVKEIEDQFENGRESITISIYSSASNVPTKTFGTNDNLAKTRAENMKYDLIQYFNKKMPKANINVVVVETTVQGPEYEGDSSNKDKYGPYQYVKLKTE